MHTKVNAMTNNSLFVFLFRFLLLSQLSVLVALATENTGLERLCNYLILLISFVLFAYSFVKNSSIKSQDLLLFTILFYLVLLAIAKGWVYDNYISCLVFFSMLTVWRSADAVSCDHKIHSTIRLFYSMQGLLLILLYFSPVAYKSYEDYVKVSSELTLGFDNPNQTGIILFSTIAILLLVSVDETNKKIKWAMFLECAALCFLLILTDARTSIIGLLVTLYFVFAKKKIKKNLLLADGIICFPLAFVYIYMLLSKTDLVNVVFWGKKLFSGRQRIYREALNVFTDKLFGNIEEFNFSNTHNAMLTILVNIGIVGIALYLLFTICSFNSLYKKCMTRKQLCCGVVILILFFMGCTETAVLTGGTIYLVHMFTILQLASGMDKDVKELES